MNEANLLKHFSLLALLFSASISFSQVQTFYVQPIQTDASYAPTEDSMAISRNMGVQLNKLFLFIGGTSSSSSTAYNALRIHSANLGFDFINLSYPNDTPAASLADDTDNLAFDKYRQEICFGTPGSTAVSVDSLNSIATRTLKILQYLETNYPSQNWDQYLTSPSAIDWSKIIIGGHSQGAGHSAFIAKQFLVDRVLMFAGPNDYSDFFSSGANWLSLTGTTPTLRHFAYLSLNDEIVDFSKQHTNLSELGMLANDDSTFVDNTAPPYQNSHFLYTTQAPGIAILNHNTPVKFSSINNDVWTYMLTASTLAGLETQNSNFEFNISPNPTSSELHIESSHSLIGKTYFLRNSKGQIVSTKRISIAEDSFIDLSATKSGVYFLSVGNTVRKVIKL